MALPDIVDVGEGRSAIAQATNFRVAPPAPPIAGGFDAALPIDRAPGLHRSCAPRASNWQAAWPPHLAKPKRWGPRPDPDDPASRADRRAWL